MRTYLYHCPITGRRVRMNGEVLQNNMKQDTAKDDKSLCQTNKKVCDGNCSSCNII